MFIPNLSKEEAAKRKQLYLSLPQPLKQAMISDEAATKLYHISWGKNQLGPNEQSVVSFTVGEALLGIIKLDDFSGILAERLELDQARAEKIYQEISLEIFRPMMVYIPKQVQTPVVRSVPPLENVVDLKNLPKE